MEGNAIAVVPGDDGDGHDLTVYVSHADAAQDPQPGRAASFGLDPEQVRVIAPHVGGAFGGKPGVLRRAHRGDRRGARSSAAR